MNPSPIKRRLSLESSRRHCDLNKNSANTSGSKNRRRSIFRPVAEFFHQGRVQVAVAGQAGRVQRAFAVEGEGHAGDAGDPAAGFADQQAAGANVPIGLGPGAGGGGLWPLTFGDWLQTHTKGGMIIAFGLH